MIRRRVHDEDDLLPAEEQDREVADRADPLDSDARRSDARGDIASRGDLATQGDAGADDELGDRDLAREGSSQDPDEDVDPGDEDDLEIEEVELEAVPEFPKNPSEDDLARLRTALEAVLFASTEGLTPTRLAEVLGVSIAWVKDGLARLADELQAGGRPYELREHGGSWRLYTREAFYPYLLRLKSLKKVEKLTPAALETLSIVAYRQPVIRAEVEAIRGVRTGPLLRALLDRKLIRVVGRAEVPGAPLQYGTTQRFLDRFGLQSIKDLPSLKEFRQGRI